jgi:hypothetical protein
MDNKDLINDEIEILDDIVEEEVLFVEEEPTYTPTYTEDHSLKDSSTISLGGEVEGHSVNDALTKFNTEETPIMYSIPEEPVVEIKEEINIPVESPNLSDELDNTLFIAKEALDPAPVVKDNAKDETKSNKRAIIFVIVLFVLLGVGIVAFPFIKEFISNLK